MILDHVSKQSEEELRQQNMRIKMMMSANEQLSEEEAKRQALGRTTQSLLTQQLRKDMIADLARL